MRQNGLLYYLVMLNHLRGITMKKRVLLSVCLIVVIGACISIAAFSTSGTENEMTQYYRTAAQCYKRISNENVQLTTEKSDISNQTVLGYYNDIPISKDDVAYKQALDKLNHNPEKNEEETVFAIAKDIYILEQSKALGLYPSDEAIKEILASETESFQTNLDENLQFCSTIGMTQEETIAWLAQLQIEGKAKANYMSHVVEDLMSEENIGDEILERMIKSLSSGKSTVDLPSSIQEICDRYVTLQVQDAVSVR